MDDAALMRVSQAFCDLSGDGQRFINRDRTS